MEMDLSWVAISHNSQCVVTLGHFTLPAGAVDMHKRRRVELQKNKELAAKLEWSLRERKRLEKIKENRWRHLIGQKKTDIVRRDGEEEYWLTCGCT